MRRLLVVGVLAFMGLAAIGGDAVETTLSSDGAGIFARRVGSGEALVLVHGGPGVSSDHLRGLERLATDRTVVTWDQRGVGRSTAAETGAYGFDAHVADLEAVRAWTGDEQIDLLGHSWGALVAVAYAKAHPERVRRLVVVNGAWPTRGELEAGWSRIHSRERALLTAGTITSVEVQGDDCTAWLEAFVPVLQADASRPVGPRGSTCHRKTLLATWDAVGEYDIRPWLADLDVPTVLVHGEEDPYGDTAGAYAAAMKRREAEVVRIEGCGHRPMHECPAEFDRVLADALR
jgi:proline iminopeptidase